MDQTVGQRLRQARIDSRMSLREVESWTGISNAFISQLETGKCVNPSIKTIIALADIYHVSIDYICEPLIKEMTEKHIPQFACHALISEKIPTCSPLNGTQCRKENE